MAVEAQRRSTVPPLKQRLETAATSVRTALPRLPILRPIRTLAGRIFFFNLAGLAILIVGVLYLSKQQAWLIEAKRESLRTQGEIIAAAIAANAALQTDSIVLDPTRLPSLDGALIQQKEDELPSYELPISPENVKPILSRLLQPTRNRARVYTRDGTFIADSDILFGREMRPVSYPSVSSETPGLMRRLEDFGARLLAFFWPTDLPIYKELGRGNGTEYVEVQAALNGIATAMLRANDRGRRIVFLAVPIRRNKVVQGALLLQTRSGEIDDLIAGERKIVAMLSLMALLATLGSSIMLARSVAGPMRKLAVAANQVRVDISNVKSLPDYSARDDEIGEMSGAFREMTEALLRRIEASEKFAADVAHELKNPITAARSTAEALAFARTEDERRELVELIQLDLRRLNRLITDISNASRLDAELMLRQAEPVDLASMLDTMTIGFNDRFSDDSRRIAFHVTDHTRSGFVVRGHDVRIGQVFTNLVDNALSFSPENGTVTVRLRRIGDEIEIAVEDEGPGIPEDRLAKVFERFYTDRPATESKHGKNSGLGLSISREIVLAYRGRIWAENRTEPAPAVEGAAQAPPKVLGARFVVRLPSATAVSSRTGPSVRRR
ncbi:MAG: stimulus-sensing domain-containing protein [Hyphomicrobiaceae bacterium]|nr:stimulus-sensing domain-containing protein [Hyphomicrobiaceae bacterium]